MIGAWNNEMIKNQRNSHEKCRCNHIRSYKSPEFFTAVPDGNYFRVLGHFSREPDHGYEYDHRREHIAVEQDEINVIFEYYFRSRSVIFDELAQFIREIEHRSQQHDHRQHKKEGSEKFANYISVKNFQHL
jgi:hypothetical protein